MEKVLNKPVSNKEAYNTWAECYDDMPNKTRDLELVAMTEVLKSLSFSEVLELGCGTGKNTKWLSGKAKHLTAVDFSKEMMSRAKEKISGITGMPNVDFKQVNLTNEWSFYLERADLITCSLVLEHIKDVNFIFDQAYGVLKPGGHFYLGELHPFRQYRGSKARFEIRSESVELECFVHHVSEFMDAAELNNFKCIDLQEWFDHDDRTTLPRLVSFLFRKEELAG